ncbi:MAG TPA: 4Fe-4S dicluster domain-containing protein [Opitutaceae bacterium]|nr:4Fe-4S dicluster domain-containing protein [Opitutaceae bacterium]
MKTPENVRRHWLKYARSTAALVVLALLGAAFVDFRDLVDEDLSHALASVQFVPAAIALATGATASVAAIAILAVTLAFGRVYCSILCPLGLLQDAVARLAGWVRRKPRLLRFAKPATWVRQTFLWATVAGIVAGWSGLTLTLLDPYSIFGRVGSMLFRPVVTTVNNWLVAPANALGLDALYRVPPQWAAVGALALPAALLLLIAVLAARRGRLYCNTVCPVGTLLGLLSGLGAWRIEIDETRCRKCGDCLRVCKAQCIDLRTGTVDNSRCVACFNCISSCDEHGIHHRLKWKPERADRKVESAVATPRAGAASGSGAAQSENASPTDASRRAFITGTAAALTAATGVVPVLAQLAAGSAASLSADDSQPPEGPHRFGRAPISPPGSGGVARFLDRCTACQLCVSACPTHVLQPAFLEYGLAGAMKPRLDFEHSFCNFECNRCGEVCPDGAILPLALDDKKLTRLGVAHIDYRLCIVKANGTDCAACSEHCPTQAVSTVPYGENLRLPEMHPELCIGCGACEYACPVRPTRAIIVKAHAEHSRAEKKVEAPAAAPAAEDLPF